MSKEITCKVHYAEKHKRKAKEFIIQIVPNRFNVDYPLYLERVGKVQELSLMIKKAAIEENLEEIERLTKEVEGIGLEGVLEAKFNLVKSLMIGNEYEYDRDWWDLKADPADINTMIAQCVLKDSTEEDKKKLQRAAKSTGKDLLLHLTSTGGH